MARRRSPEWLNPVLLVTLIAVVGAAIRVVVVQQSIFADELSTYWIVSTHGLRGVVSTVQSDAEISPPLSFAAAWFTTQIHLSPEMLRLASLVAGATTVPLVYLVGARTVGRAAGVVASAFTALSPFMIYYSAEARGYALMMAFVLASTLSMLMALDDRRARWWVAYAVFSCLSVYTHYTCVFVLGVQLLWLLATHPEARRPALLANAAAAVAFVPWLHGLRADLDSPTTDILSKLAPFNEEQVRLSLAHWALGYPYATIVSLAELPGITAIVLLGLATILGVVGVVIGRSWQRARPAGDRRVLLIVALALSTPVCEAIFSALGSSSFFGTRNLAASWPALALGFAALLLSAGPRLRIAATALALLAFGIGATKMLEDQFHRPNYQAAGTFINHNAGPRDVIIDESANLSPGPLSHVDPILDPGHRVFRSGSPQESDHPFNVFDKVVSPEAAARAAVAAAGGGRIFFLTGICREFALTGTCKPRPAPRALRSYRLTESHTYPGIFNVVVRIYAKRSAG